MIQKEIAEIAVIAVIGKARATADQTIGKNAKIAKDREIGSKNL